MTSFPKPFASPNTIAPRTSTPSRTNTSRRDRAPSRRHVPRRPAPHDGGHAALDGHDSSSSTPTRNSFATTSSPPFASRRVTSTRASKLASASGTSAASPRRHPPRAIECSTADNANALEVLADIEAQPEAAEFLAAFRSYLDEFGWRNGNADQNRTWAEEPVVPSHDDSRLHRDRRLRSRRRARAPRRRARSRDRRNARLARRRRPSAA